MILSSSSSTIQYIPMDKETHVLLQPCTEEHNVRHTMYPKNMPVLTQKRIHSVYTMWSSKTKLTVYKYQAIHFKKKRKATSSKIILTILAAGCNTCICFRMVAPSFVIVTSPFPSWICQVLFFKKAVFQKLFFTQHNDTLKALLILKFLGREVNLCLHSLQLCLISNSLTLLEWFKKYAATV